MSRSEQRGDLIESVGSIFQRSRQLVDGRVYAGLIDRDCDRFCASERRRAGYRLSRWRRRGRALIGAHDGNRARSCELNMVNMLFVCLGVCSFLCAKTVSLTTVVEGRRPSSTYSSRTRLIPGRRRKWLVSSRCQSRGLCCVVNSLVTIIQPQSPPPPPLTTRTPFLGMRSEGPGRGREPRGV
ncbi:hypothetical protein BC835DRAFT_1011970 [Cytidiella melzeri]|nr:hypothetical protein BC835DRAFT_1011970 [Cytidiella melzeri]